uniref:Mannose-binding lectin n=1 Tax=Amaryllis minuta TaxID=146466 RepID=Q6XCI6_9ASPA|nr:mannose-binding lectin [Amaryllis minuta]
MTTVSINVLLLATTLGLLMTTGARAANVLQSGQQLGTGGSLDYAAYNFRMQADCNLVLYDNGNAVWASGTNGRGSGCTCRMQYDGNLVVYTNANRAVWASNTNRGTGSYQLILQRDRNVVIYDPSGRAIWATGTNVAAANVTLSAARPTNLTITAAKLTNNNNVPAAATEKASTSNGSNPTQVPVTTAGKN